MRKLTIITVLCLLLMSVNILAVSAEEETQPSITKASIAIIPYINSTEETKGYIKEIVDAKYTEQYSNKNFQIIPLVETQKALNIAGFDTSNKELPDKDILAIVAEKTNADYVIAMEISQLITTRHMSMFQMKVVTKAKLRYKVYNVKQSKLVTFQVTGASENKTVFGDVGYRDPITKALNQAMDEANVKILNSL
ncbi:hypothetical protein [Sporomusa sp.]|uniref:hypothetical protein n=1 Tax=Sporomusa sp. TaxID=2078658 RepID=UPI002B9CCD6F|nr:hypothetical protein [Sporomusa sp.]HWR44142.1 hypothetical protein [Sporomusa sp.]